MTDDELIAYFDGKELPESLRLDMATTQHKMREMVPEIIAGIRRHPKEWRARHQLKRIMNALENPYSGPEIPKA